MVRGCWCSVLDLLADWPRNVLLVNSLGFNAVVIDLLSLRKASVAARHRRQGWRERSEVPSLRDLDDLRVLPILALGSSALLVVTLIDQRDDVAAVVTLGLVFLISKRVVVVPVN